MTDCFIDTELLPNKKFPMIFHSVKGKCQLIKSNSDSLASKLDKKSKFNEEEITIVLSYIKQLRNRKWKDREIELNEIGVVSPYKRQVVLIKKALADNGFEGITVGTAEKFQGLEKLAMIVSTVRSDGKLGFVSNQQVSLCNFLGNFKISIEI